MFTDKNNHDVKSTEGSVMIPYTQVLRIVSDYFFVLFCIFLFERAKQRSRCLLEFESVVLHSVLEKISLPRGCNSSIISDTFRRLLITTDTET